MPDSGRRSYDREIDPAIEAYVERTVADTRHVLREEFGAALLSITNKLTELGVSLTAGHLQSTKEHAAVQASLQQLQRDVKTLQPLDGRVTKLERHDDVDDARDDEREKVIEKLEDQKRWMAGTRRWVIGCGLTIISLLVGAIALVLSHLH